MSIGAAVGVAGSCCCEIECGWKMMKSCRVAVVEDNRNVGCSDR